MSAVQHIHAHALVEQLRERLLRSAPEVDPGLDARRTGHLRERDALLARVAALRATPSASHEALHRLAVDVDHHLQRRRDLAWDDVELELGGSE
jgi:hypothetical protein